MVIFISLALRTWNPNGYNSQIYAPSILITPGPSLPQVTLEAFCLAGAAVCVLDTPVSTSGIQEKEKVMQMDDLGHIDLTISQQKL